MAGTNGASNVFAFNTQLSSIPHLKPENSAAIYHDKTPEPGHPHHVLAITYSISREQSSPLKQHVLLLGVNHDYGHTFFVDAVIDYNADIFAEAKAISKYNFENRGDRQAHWQDIKDPWNPSIYANCIDKHLSYYANRAATYENISKNDDDIKKRSAAFFDIFTQRFNEFTHFLDPDVVKAIDATKLKDRIKYETLYQLIHGHDGHYENTPPLLDKSKKNTALLEYIEKYPFLISMLHDQFIALSEEPQALKLPDFENRLQKRLVDNAPDSFSYEKKAQKSQEIMTWLEGKTYHAFENPASLSSQRLIIENPITSLRKLFLLDQDAWPNNPLEWTFVENLYQHVLEYDENISMFINEDMSMLTNEDMSMFTNIIHTMFKVEFADIRAYRIECATAVLSWEDGPDRLSYIMNKPDQEPLQGVRALTLVKTSAPSP